MITEHTIKNPNTGQPEVIVLRDKATGAIVSGEAPTAAQTTAFLASGLSMATLHGLHVMEMDATEQTQIRARFSGGEVVQSPERQAECSQRWQSQKDGGGKALLRYSDSPRPAKCRRNTT